MAKTIEDLLIGVTDALHRQSDLLEEMLKNAPKSGGTAPAKTKDEEPEEKPKTTRRAPAKTKEEEEPEEKPKTTRRTPAKKKDLELADVVAQFAEYAQAGDDDEQDEAADNLEAICDYFKIERISHLEPADFDEALKYLAQAKKSGKITFDGGEEEEPDEKPRRRRI